MANGTVNKVFIIGNIIKVPELKRTEKCNYIHLSIATLETWRDKVTQELKERTEQHLVVIYGKLAEVAERLITKGDKVCIIGRMQTRKWTDLNNIEREKVEIIGEELQLVSKL